MHRMRGAGNKPWAAKQRSRGPSGYRYHYLAGGRAITAEYVKMLCRIGQVPGPGLSVEDVLWMEAEAGGNPG